MHLNKVFAVNKFQGRTVLASFFLMGFGLTACSSDDGGSAACSASVCKDEMTLLYCDNGRVSEQSCQFGCTENRCRGDKECASDVCQDENHLLKCGSNGQSLSIVCKYGCGDNACRPAPECAERCQDAKTLLACGSDGQSFEKVCEYGCADNACRPAPECAERCQDAKTLLACGSDGQSFEKVCEYGCADNACRQEACKNTCKDAHTLLNCAANGQVSEMSCEFGCASGACISEAETACNLEDPPRCEGNILYYCAESGKKTVLTAIDCPKNYICSEYDGQPMCLEKCDSPGSQSHICSSSFIIGSICTKTDSGNVYIPDYSSQGLCEAGCLDLHTCAESSCSPDTYIESCSGSNGARYCEGSDVIYNICSPEKACYISSDNKAKCGIICDPADNVDHICYVQNPDDPSSRSAYAEVSCRKGDTAWGYEILSYTECSAGCDNIKGCL